MRPCVPIPPPPPVGTDLKRLSQEIEICQLREELAAAKDRTLTLGVLLALCFTLTVAGALASLWWAT
jgi:hypothetical protein